MTVNWRRSNLLVPRQYVRRILTNAEVLALFSSSVTLLPADPNKLYLPLRLHSSKPAGTAYTLNGATQFQIRLGTTIYLQHNLAGMLDQATQQVYVSVGPGNAAGIYTGALNNNNLNVTMNAFINNANVTLGTSPLEILVEYEEFPISFGW